MPRGDELENEDQEGTAEAVSRRFVLRRAAAFAVSAPDDLAVLQACGGDKEEAAGGGGQEEPAGGGGEEEET